MPGRFERWWQRIEGITIGVILVVILIGYVVSRF